MTIQDNGSQSIRAPEEPRHVAWGVSPRDRDPMKPESPVGVTAFLVGSTSCRRPAGADSRLR